MWKSEEDKLKRSGRKWQPSPDYMPYRCAELFCEECGADTAKVWARRLYESRYTEPMTDKLVKAEVQSYIKEQMSHKEMLDLIQGTVQAAVAECKDKTKQFAQTEVEKYLKGAVVMNAIHEEIKRVVPQAVLDALRGV